MADLMVSDPEHSAVDCQFGTKRARIFSTARASKFPPEGPLRILGSERDFRLGGFHEPSSYINRRERVYTDIIQTPSDEARGSQIVKI